jgi:hypothetical protein
MGEDTYVSMDFDKVRRVLAMKAAAMKGGTLP